MSDFSGTPGERTRYSASIELTARELEALQRLVEDEEVDGDIELNREVARRIVASSKRVPSFEDIVSKSDPGPPPSTDLHRE